MTIAVKAQATGSYPPQVRVDVTSSPSMTAPLTLTRVHDDGAEYPVLLGGNPSIIGTYTGVDFHPPFNRVVTYRASGGGFIAVSGPVVVSSSRTWLVHPSDPDRSMLVEIIASVDDYSYESASTSYRPLGSRLPVVRHDFPTGGESGQITIICQTPATRKALKKLLAGGGLTLLNTPYSDDDIGWKWVQIDSHTIHNPGGRQAHPERHITLPYREAVQPDVDSAVWVLGELKSHAALQYPTLADLKETYTGKTLRDLKLRVL